MGKLFSLLFSITLAGAALAEETAATAGPEPISVGYGSTSLRSSAVVAAVVRRHLPGVENAYVAALEREPGLRGGYLSLEGREIL